MRTTSPPPDPAPRERLRRMSLRMQALAALGAMSLVLLPFWALHDDPQGLLARLHGIDASGLFTPPLPLTWMAVISALPGVAIGLFALWQVWQLFASYGRGVVFGLEPTKRLRRLGFALLGAAVLQALMPTALVLALTLGNPPGQRRLMLSVGSEHYLMLLLGGLLIVIAWAMAEGERLQHENEGFV